MIDRGALFARLCDAVREGVYVGRLAAAGNVTLAANPHLRTILGLSADTPDAAVDPFARERFADARAYDEFITRLHGGGALVDFLIRVRRDDGALIWLEVTAQLSHSPPSGARATTPQAAPSGDAGPATAVLYALLRDVSARKTNESQSRDLYQQLLQAEKMAALGQTISGVAHELNNPLATILTWAERLAEGHVDDKARRGLGVILAESERAARIVRNLLTFARKRQTTRMMVDLNEIVRDTLALRAYEQHVSNIVASHSLSPALPEIFADAHQVKQVLLNLIINAEQAMMGAHGRGRLVVRTWHDADRDAVVLEVNDDGPGIPADVQGKIFDPFFTTKDVGEGTGLGLSVAYGIVQEHGGRIWITSRARIGSSFFVEFPLAGQALEPRRPRLAPVSLEEFKGAKVLIVEDELALATAMVEALTDAGLIVDRASDGEEGLTCVAQRSYDLIVCDLKMPRLDGMQFYRAMTASAPALVKRLIFVTGAMAGTDAERFLQETRCRWLAKPFRTADLMRVVRETLSEVPGTAT